MRAVRLFGLGTMLALGACGGGGAEPTNNQAAPSASSPGNAAAPALPRTGPGNTATVEVEPGSDHDMILDAQGLRAEEAELGTSGALSFGTGSDLAVEALTHIIGAAPASDSTTAACGPLPTRMVRWAAGFTLVARDGRFVGWEVDRPGYAFDNNVGVGSTYRELGQAFPVTFSRSAGDIGFTVTGRDSPPVGGTLAGLRGDARVLSLHAGATCDPDAQPVPAPAVGVGNQAAPRRR